MQKKGKADIILISLIYPYILVVYYFFFFLKVRWHLCIKEIFKSLVLTLDIFFFFFLLYLYLWKATSTRNNSEASISQGTGFQPCAPLWISATSWILSSQPVSQFKLPSHWCCLSIRVWHEGKTSIGSSVSVSVFHILYHQANLAHCGALVLLEMSTMV